MSKVRQARRRQPNKPADQTSQPTKTQSISTTRVDPEESDELLCLTCLEPITVYSIGSFCSHNTVLCATCSVRMRCLYNNNQCIVCKCANPAVVLSPELKPYNQFPLTSFSVLRGSGIYFANQQIEESINTLFEHKCALCETSPLFPNLAKLQQHLREQHKKLICTICLEGSKKFLHERELFTPETIKTHNDHPTDGHPQCGFCNKRFFDSDGLFYHMESKYQRCKFCSEHFGEYKYFENFTKLRFHCESVHCLCCHCDQVFSSPEELREHQNNSLLRWAKEKNPKKKK